MGLLNELSLVAMFGVPVLQVRGVCVQLVAAKFLDLSDVV